MSATTQIEWADKTWNPVTGCSRVSPGCENCYAEAVSLRYGYTRLPWTARNAPENVRVHRDRLAAPLSWRKPVRVFVNSMSDLFHEQVPDEFIERVFAVMALTPRHTFQILTKRPERMRDLLSQPNFGYSQNGRYFRGGREDLRYHWALHPMPLPNVWLGVSAEDQRRADERIPFLRETPAAVRFISAEPLLGPIDLRGGQQLDWIIAGGESGPRFRPLDLDWARSLRAQARAAGIPFLFKQVGGRTAKAGGRLLDGRTWDEFPGERV